jgi:hypothetical protein
MFTRNIREEIMRTALTLSAIALSAMAAASPTLADDALRFQVDASWPQPLPNNWIMGQAAGVSVDAQDHIWVIQRPRTLTDDEKASSFMLGAGPARATTGRRTSTASASTPRASSGSAAMAPRTAST